MAENFELYIEPKLINPVNGQFIKKHIPFNKGLPMKEWMDGRKIKRVVGYLEIGHNGNKNLPGANRKQVVGIKDGVLKAFRDSLTAEKYVRSLGIKINSRNINKVCNKTKGKVKVGKYEYNYIRKRAGGYQWFFADDIEKYKHLLLDYLY